MATTETTGTTTDVTVEYDPPNMWAVHHDGLTIRATLVVRSAVQARVTLRVFRGDVQLATDTVTVTNAQQCHRFAASLRESHDITLPSRVFLALDQAIQQVRASATQAGPERSTAGADTRPVIWVNEGDLSIITRQAWETVATANSPESLLRWAGVLVRIRADEQGGVRPEPLGIDALRHEVASLARWMADDGRGGATSVHPPLSVVRSMAATADPPIPALRRVVHVPVLREDGTIVATPGFDSASGVYYAPATGFVVPAVPESPAEADLDEARRWLAEELLGDFPFVGDADRAHAVAMLLQPLVRGFITGPTPMYSIDKPTPGTGASLLAACLGIVTCGRTVPASTEARTEDETRKRLFAHLLSDPEIVLLDNQVGRVESAALAAMLTSTTFQDRILGVSQQAVVTNHAVWVMTSNNVAMSAEFVRRIVRIRLDARVERPWERRDFRHADLLGWAMRERGTLVWALLVLARRWIAAGRPRWEGVPPGSFESWAAVLGGILGHAGIPGFLGNRDASFAELDTESGDWAGLVCRWEAAFHAEPVAVAQLWPLVAGGDGEDALDLGLREGSEHSMRTQFGRRLHRMRERQFGEFRIARVEGQTHGAGRWCLVRVSPPPGAGGGGADVPPDPPQRNLQSRNGLQDSGEGGEVRSRTPDHFRHPGEQKTVTAEPGSGEPPHPPPASPRPGDERQCDDDSYRVLDPAVWSALHKAGYDGHEIAAMSEDDLRHWRIEKGPFRKGV